MFTCSVAVSHPDAWYPSRAVRIVAEVDVVTTPEVEHRCRWSPAHCGHGVALFDLDRTLLPGSSLGVFGRGLVREGLVSRRRVARHAALEALFQRRGLGAARIDRMVQVLMEMSAGWRLNPCSRSPARWGRPWRHRSTPPPASWWSATSGPGTSASSCPPVPMSWSKPSLPPSVPSAPSAPGWVCTTGAWPAAWTDRSATAPASSRLSSGRSGGSTWPRPPGTRIQARTSAARALRHGRGRQPGQGAPPLSACPRLAHRPLRLNDPPCRPVSYWGSCRCWRPWRRTSRRCGSSPPSGDRSFGCRARCGSCTTTSSARVWVLRPPMMLRRRRGGRHHRPRRRAVGSVDRLLRRQPLRRVPTRHGTRRGEVRRRLPRRRDRKARSSLIPCGSV